MEINTYVRHFGNLPKGNGLPQQAEVAQGVPGRLKPQIFLTFGTTRVVGRQPYAPATFTPGEIPGTHFLEAESTIYKKPYINFVPSN
jgi:hypothetical protein